MTGRCRGDRRRPKAGFCTVLVRADHGRSDGHRGTLRVVRDGPRTAVTSRGHCRPYHNQGYGLRNSTLDRYSRS